MSGSTYAVWPSIVAGCAVGGMTLGALFWGPFRKFKSTDQLRWVLQILSGFVTAIGAGAIALHQGNHDITDADDNLLKTAYYANHILLAVSIVTLIANVTLGIFADFGARLILPVLALIVFGFTTVSIFEINSGFNLWYYFMITLIVLVVHGFLFFFVDRLDLVAKLPTSQRQPIGGFEGLGWRIGALLMAAVAYICWVLCVDTFGVMNVLGSQIFMAFVYVGCHIFIFFNVWMVRGAEPVYDGTTLMARDPRDAAAEEQQAFGSKRRAAGKV